MFSERRNLRCYCRCDSGRLLPPENAVPAPVLVPSNIEAYHTNGPATGDRGRCRRTTTSQQPPALGVPPHRPRTTPTPAATRGRCCCPNTATLPATARARSRCLRTTPTPAAARLLAYHRISGPVSAQHKPPGTARRNIAEHRQPLAFVRPVTGAQEREPRPSLKRPGSGAPKRGAQPTPLRHANSAPKRGSRPSQQQPAPTALHAQQRPTPSENTATATQATEPARCEGCGSRPFSRLISA